MTNKKEIIINGIDISECIFHSLTTMGYVGYNYCKCFGCVCKCHNDCYYKQLKRKEQECEEIKEKVKELRQGWIDCDKERNLQEANSEFNQRVADRYEQTLAEIKEIAEEDFNHTCWEAYAEQLKQILQKISECGVHND